VLKAALSFNFTNLVLAYFLERVVITFQLFFMKKRLPLVSVLACTLFTLFSCQKVNSVNDDELLDKKKNKKDLCLISSFGYSNPSVPSQTIFTNHYDFAGRTLQVEAGVFNAGAIVSNTVFNVEWSPAGIAFTNANAHADTILFATFDRRGRIDKIVPGNKPDFEFLPTAFEYTGNRLSGMRITLAGADNVSYFNYDSKGNLTLINDLPTPSVPVPGRVEYQYASNQKASGQFYFDEPRKFSWNTFSLLQYIGLFPELQPVNLRTSTKVNWGNNYQAYYMNIANQQLDQQGKLVGYDVVSPGSGSTISHYNINWSCNSELVQNVGNQ